MYLVRPASAGLFCLLAAASLGHGDASAQQIYKIVGADGRVTFSDQPPREPAARAKAAPVVALPAAGANLAGLPFEVRQAAARFPVTLYTTANCNTCTSGRSMLMARGIPFSEKTVSTSEDFEALKRMAGGNVLPLLTIGSQQLKGYGETEWAQFLDAAGYPKTSQLPASYLPSPASPLVAIEQVRPPAPAPTAQRQAPAAAAGDAVPALSADNPAGIRF